MDGVVEVTCPTCGEPTAVALDVGAQQGRVRVESDCQVCCRPLHVIVTVRRGQVVAVEPGFGW